MKADEPAGPADVRPFGSQGITPQTEFIAGAVEELFGLGRVRRVCRFNISGHNFCLLFVANGL
jgi:hypothetical protein